MNAEERRQARRKRILENSENRLKKITLLSTNVNLLNGQAEFVKDQQENSIPTPEPFDRPVPNSHIQNVTPTIIKDQPVFIPNREPNDLNPKSHSKPVKYEINFSSITILHILLSQIVLILFYYDLGFLFGNSIVMPFLLSAIPEIYTLKEQHDNMHMIVLLMLGFSQDLAKQISRCAKMASVIGKRFCIYIFCFTCSYAVLINQYNDIKHIDPNMT